MSTRRIAAIALGALLAGVAVNYVSADVRGPEAPEPTQADLGSIDRGELKPLATAAPATPPLAVPRRSDLPNISGQVAAGAAVDERAQFAAKVHRWAAEFRRKCGNEVAVDAMHAEAMATAETLLIAGDRARRQQIPSHDRRDEQNGLIRRVIDRWCARESGRAQSIQCKKAFVFCYVDKG